MIGSRSRRKHFFFQAGFSLLEILVGVFIFTIILGVVASIFIQSSQTSRNQLDEQRELEHARQAIEQMAREIRTGTDVQVLRNDCNPPDVIPPNGNGNCVRFSVRGTQTRFSPEIPRIEYTEEGNRLVRRVNGGPSEVVSSIDLDRLRIHIPPNGENSVRRVTILLRVRAGDVPDPYHLQTTVSLRSF